MDIKSTVKNYQTKIQAFGNKDELDAIRSVIESYSQEKSSNPYYIINSIKNIEPNGMIVDTTGPCGHFIICMDMPLFKEIAEAAPTAHYIGSVRGSRETTMLKDDSTVEKYERFIKYDIELIDGILYLQWRDSYSLDTLDEEEPYQKIYFTKAAETIKPVFWVNEWSF